MATAAALALPGSALAATGGKPASRDYPYMAALFKDGRFNCGGSLIHPEWVLTAAHCVPAGSRISFRIGGHSLGDPQNESRDGVETILHEAYNAQTQQFDVALVRLDKASSKATLRLARPPAENSLWSVPGGDLIGKEARVIGYGLPNSVIGELFEVDIKMVSDESCELSYGSGFHRATMVCAGEHYGVEDSCFGDSGGPLMVSSAGTLDSGSLVQVGAVSWGTLCGVPTQYGVYSRVADQLLYDWIQAKLPDAPPADAGSEPESGGTTAPTTGDTPPNTCVPHEHRDVHLHGSSEPHTESHVHRTRHVHRRRHAHRARHGRRRHIHKRVHIHSRNHSHPSSKTVYAEHVHTESHPHCS